MLEEDAADEEEGLLFRRLRLNLGTLGLTPFSGAVAVEYLKAQLSKEGGPERLSRVVGHLLNLLNGKRPTRALYQTGCPNVIPNLTTRLVWGQGSESLRDVFPWVALLEDNVGVILNEFFSLRGTDAFQPYRSPPPSTITASSTNATDALGQLATDSGSWNVAYLYLHGLDFADNLLRCPKTAAIVAQIPRHYHHCFFSSMAPQTHITPHYGSTNKKLRCHLPLVVPSSTAAWLRVGDERVEMQQGRCVIFDDSHEHEAGNDDFESPRVVLIVDVWHPDLSDEEVRFLSFVNKGQLAAAHRLANQRKVAAESEEGSRPGPGSDFLSVILNARAAAGDGLATVSDAAVWGVHRVVDD
jgi:aspartate beta-hydroxylase